MATLSWTFYGPRAAGIAEHHAKHLREFAAREGLDGVQVDVAATSEPPGMKVSMRVHDSVRDSVARALRPNAVD